jgi:hypothetical protein
MKVCEAVEEMKSKRTMLGPTRDSSSSALLRYRMVYMPPVGQLCRPPQFTNYASMIARPSALCEV